MLYVIPFVRSCITKGIHGFDNQDFRPRTGHFHSFITTGHASGLHYFPLGTRPGLAYSSLKHLPTTQFSQVPPIGVLFASPYRFARKRIYELLNAESVICIGFLESVFDIRLYCAPISANCADAISSVPEAAANAINN